MNIKNNCRKATLLLEKKQWGKISLPERLELTIHLARCPQCRIYKLQSNNINLLMDNFFEAKSGVEIIMDENRQQEIQKIIEDRLEKNI